MAEKALKIYFYVFDLVGPQNSCIGFGQTLLKRGHDVHFLVNDQFTGHFAKFGFKEHILKSASISQKGSDPIKDVCDLIVDYELFDPMTPIECLRRTFKTGFYDYFYENWSAFEPQMKAIITRDKPDLLVIDSDIAPPCLLYAEVPYVYLFCSNPLGILDFPTLPPFTSGLRIDDDPKIWKEFRDEKIKIHDSKTIKFQTKLCEKYGYPPLKTKSIVPKSSFLNLIQYTNELSYEDVVELPENYFRVDSFIRFEPEEFELPKDFRSKMKDGDKLIYLSLGSMGCCNLKLMRRLINILASTKHFYIVSKGILADQYELANNMWGEAKIPQTKVLPLIDLFITHGGNNSTMEAFFFGKPVIVFPQFFDQFDNATRVAEKNYGYSFNHNDFNDQDLLDTIERILNDKPFLDKCRRMGERIRHDDRAEKACIEIEKRLERFQK